jgi:hypothetical protein
MLGAALLQLSLEGDTGRHMSDFNIVINRTRINSASLGGELSIGGRRICYTLELPWLWNQRNVSCIPNGRYFGRLRYDKADAWRIQLIGVRGRSGIQIHIGNYPRDTQGCVLVGTSIASNAVLGSKAAYELLKESFYGTRNPTQCPAKNVSVEFKGILASPPGDYPRHSGRDRTV